MLTAIETKVAQIKVNFLGEKQNVSMAKMLTEATPEYAELKRQMRKCARIIEFIRIAKLRGRMKQDEMYR